MRVYSLEHLSDSALLQNTDTIAAHERTTTAEFLAHIAEIDARKLYAPAGYPSTYAYCVERLHLSEGAAYRRLHAARAARRFPAIFDAVADGRIHLSGVGVIAPHLTQENVNELLELATHRQKSEIEVALARRLSRPVRAEAPTASVRPVPTVELADGDGKAKSQAQLRQAVTQNELLPGEVRAPVEPEVSYLLQVRLNERVHAKLREMQDLLSHAVPNGDLMCLLERSFDMAIAELKRRKFAAVRREGGRTSALANGAANGAANERARSTTALGRRARHIPAYVKRAVWARDGMRCTFLNDAGQRCSARRFLELDHVEPVARGGRASIAGLRVRCRTHNQMEAERTFGAGFMNASRGAARAKRAERVGSVVRAERAACAHGSSGAADARIAAHDRDLIRGLHGLGVRLDEARLALAEIPSHEQASLEERLRAALRWVGRGASMAAFARGQQWTLAGAPAP